MPSANAPHCHVDRASYGLQDVLAHYNSAFGTLMGLRIMSWQLQQQWRQAVQQQGGEASSHSQDDCHVALCVEGSSQSSCL